MNFVSLVTVTWCRRFCTMVRVSGMIKVQIPRPDSSNIPNTTIKDTSNSEKR